MSPAVRIHKSLDQDPAKLRISISHLIGSDGNGIISLRNSRCADDLRLCLTSCSRIRFYCHIDLVTTFCFSGYEAASGTSGKSAQIVYCCFIIYQDQDLVSLLFQQSGEGSGVRALGDGGAYVTVVVEHGQPGALASTVCFILTPPVFCDFL